MVHDQHCQEGFANDSINNIMNVIVELKRAIHHQQRFELKVVVNSVTIVE